MGHIILLILAFAGVASAQCTFTISPTRADVGASSATGTIEVSVASGCSWTAVSNAAWITVTFGQSGTRSGSVGWAVDRNTYATPRTGTVTVAGQTFTITQAAAACEFTLLPAASSKFGGEGGTGAFTVKSLCSWAPVASAGWIHITSIGADGAVHYSVDPNGFSPDRSGFIQVGDQRYLITQGGPCVSLSAPPRWFDVAVTGGSFTLTVTAPAGCQWTAASTVPWITVTGGASGTANGAVQYTVAANNAGARTGTIRVNDLTFTVSQTGIPCDAVLDPASATIPAAGGTGKLTVTTGAGCTWTAASTAAWITITSTTASAVEYTVAANAAAARSGTLTIAGKTFTVNQAGGMELREFKNAANYVEGSVAPGEIVTLFGSGLGPADLVQLQLEADGVTVKNSLGGTRVLFDGVPAPLVYAWDKQVSAVAPFGLAGRITTQVQVEFAGARTNVMTIPVVASLPGLFSLDATGSGQGAILNQDYGVNGPANPAPAGSVLMIFATGGGLTDPLATDGRVTAELQRLRLPVTVRIGGIEANVSFAGGAPGLVPGLVQINAEIPAGVAPGPAVPVTLRIGDVETRQQLTVAVR